MSLLFALALHAHAQEVLPLERIRFYETGVAYFQREGTVSDSTTLPVPMAHLDDALKTLVVLSEDVEVGAITFPSAVSNEAARVMAGLDHQSAGPVGFLEALRSLQGVEVLLKTTDGSQVTAVLLDVDGPLARSEGESETSVVLPAQYALTLLDGKGGVLRTTTESVASVRPVAEDMTSRLHQAAQTMASGNARRTNGLALQLWKPGRLGLGYIAETPIWRVSYRLVLRENKPANMQAWALIHNDTDEVWEGVSVELANGEPDSFLFPLASPRYMERTLITPEVDLSSVPQLATETPDAMWDSGKLIAGTGYGYGGVGSGGIGAIGGSPIILGGTDSPLAQLKEAVAVETPTQFIYKVARPVDLAAHHSALVPVVQAEIDAERAVVFAPKSVSGRNGIWITNDTERTLPAGVAAVFEGGGLAGESTLTRLKPEENQMVLFGNELDIEIERSSSIGATVVRTVQRNDNRLRVETVSPRTSEVAVTNRTQRDQTLWYALALGPQEEFIGEVRQEIDPSRGWTYAVLDIQTGSEEIALQSEHRNWDDRDPASVSTEEYLSWADAGLHPELFQRAADARLLLRNADDALAVAHAAMAARKEQVASLRQDMLAAQGADGTQVFARKVANLEQEIRRQKPTIARLADKRAAALNELLAVLEGLDAST